MKIRNKVLLYFSVTSILLVGIIFLIVFWIFSEYREEEFQQRQKDKIITTLHFITEIERNEKELTNALDRININSILNEKLLIFDSNKKLIYSSLDDVPVNYSEELLNQLDERNEWIERKDGLYDVVAIRFMSNESSYYGISKAYDEFGYTKLSTLKTIFISAFLVFTILVVLISIYLANRIAKPITQLSRLLGQYRMGDPASSDRIKDDTYEIEYLNQKFNELVTRVNNAYTFQKNSIQHISHQLKTPIAVLISELERMKLKASNDLVPDIDKQIIKTKYLAEIINTLLIISKIEAGQEIEKQKLRIDELIFDCIAEANMLYPRYNFEVQYTPATPDAELLIVHGNDMMLKQAFQNLLNNCIIYGDNSRAVINIEAVQRLLLKVTVSNSGKSVSKMEQEYLFTHFFRGENSRNKMGFGLGLVLTKNIIGLHGGQITYSSPAENSNVFEVVFDRA